MRKRRSLKLLALTLAGLIVAGLPLRSADEKTTAAKKSMATVAHMRLAGDMEEGPIAFEPMFGGGVNFKSRLERIKKAQEDKNVQALYLEIEDLNIGWAKVEELRAAIAGFRKTGRKAVAYMESGTTKDFLVAAACDRVTVPPSGWLMLTGLQAQVTFFKGLLDKLGIIADFLHMGIYKSAAEMLTRTNMSPEARKQTELVFNDFFKNCLVAPISRSRRRAGRKDLTPERVQALIDEGPFTARRALEVGLIDRIAYAEQVEEALKADLMAGELKVMRNYGRDKSKELDLSNPFSILKLLSPPKTSAKSGKPRIALVYASGVIVTGKSGFSLLGGTSVGSTTLVEALRQADKDPTVKAIVLRVDSPGGSALASDLIWQAVRQCKKPVVASMSDVAASGGYYISMAARKIYAEPGTLTGSIGVVGGKIALRGLYDKVGITTEVIRRGANAGILSGVDVFSKSERKAMEALMLETYDQFVSKAMEGRARAGKHFTRSQFTELAEGRIWTGRQAKENGLIDELGSLDTAVADAKTLGGLGRDADVEFLILPKAQNFLDRLLESQSDAEARLSALAGTLRSANVPELSDHVRTLAGLLQLRGEPVWAMMPHEFTIR
jgi:protease IV